MTRDVFRMSGSYFINKNQGEHVHVHVGNKHHCRTAGSEARREEKLQIN